MALTEKEEQEVRAIIAIYRKQAPSLSDDLAIAARGLMNDWDGSSHAYAAGERVVYNDVLYTCLQSHTSQSDWFPTAAPSLWAQVLEAGTAETPSDEVPEWEPTSATVNYPLGARVKHNGKVWESLVANNVWEPGTVGTETVWREVTEG